jgi:hypothetical protein
MGNEPEKKLITTQVVSASTGKSQESWRLAAEAELNNFLDMSAIHESTAEERAAHGRPLPMICVWTEAGERFKCRACVCGNFATPDPEMKSWTAQAEPSSFLASLKLGCLRGWTRSKHDVKGAFLYAGIPKDRVVIVQPPALWVRWGLVPQGVTWTLDKAVYGLCESPAWWGEERDKQLRGLRWTDPMTKISYFLAQNPADSQVWHLRQAGVKDETILGTLLVYVDDFLLQTLPGSMRTSFLDALGSVWTLAKERSLLRAAAVEGGSAPRR